MNEIRDNMSDEIIPVGAVEIGEDGNIFYTANVLRRKFREKYPEGRIFVGLPKRVNPDPAAVDEYITECKIYAKATDAPEAFIANAFAKKKSDEKIDGYAWSQTAAVVAALGNAGITNPVISPADKYNIIQAKENDIEAAEETQAADILTVSEPVKTEEPVEKSTPEPNVYSDIDKEMAKINEDISQQLFAEDVKLEREADVASAVVGTESTEENETAISEEAIFESNESTSEKISEDDFTATEVAVPEETETGVVTEEESVTTDVSESLASEKAVTPETAEDTEEETPEPDAETATTDVAESIESETLVVSQTVEETPLTIENESKSEDATKNNPQSAEPVKPYYIKKRMDETIKNACNELAKIPEMVNDERTFSEAIEICQNAIQAAANIKATVMPGRSYHRVMQSEKLLLKKLEETIPLIGEEHLHLNVAGTSLVSETPSHADESEEVSKETEPTVHKNSSNTIPSIDDTSITDEDKIKEYEKIVIRTSISDTAEDSGMTIKEMFERVKNGDRKAIRILNWYRQSKPGEEKRKFWKDVILYLIDHGYGE